MSGIYGLYRYHGGPVPEVWPGNMRSAMAFYGPDGGGTKREGSLALGHLLLKVMPEDAQDSQPIVGCRGLVVTAARLDNRQELLTQLDVAAPAATISDGQIVSLAFDRWGEEVSTHLEGDWALAGWDRRKRTLLLARDACGNENLYFHSGPDYLAFASSMKALLAIPEVIHEPELLRLAEILVGWQYSAELTEFKGFRRLQWAHNLRVESDGSAQLSRYWFPDRREPLNYRRDEEYEEEFLERYTSAVRSCLRCNGRVGATLSGGRDSGSVTAIAAELVGATNSNCVAYTSVPSLRPDGAAKTRIGNEWDLAHATAIMAGPHVRHVAIDADHFGVLDGIKHFLEVHDGPSHASSHHYWLRAIVEAAVGDGVSVLLTGQAGNATVSWAGNGSALLALLQGQPRIAWQLFLYAETSPWLTIKRQVLKPVLTPALRWARRLRSPGRPAWQAYSALNPRFASILDIDGRMREARHDATFTPSPLRDRRLRLLRPAVCIGTGIWSELGARHGISIRDPTSNLALTEFLLRVPDCQFRRHGQESHLFRRAMRAKLPASVLEGRQKGLQAADLGHRLLRELPEIRACLDLLESHPIAGELLDVGSMRQCLESLSVKVDRESTEKAAGILLRGIDVGLFLLRFGERTP